MRRLARAGLSIVMLAGAAAASSASGQTVGRFTGHPVLSLRPYSPSAPPLAADGPGLYVTSRGRAVDLAAPDGLMDGPRGALFDQAAGFGWKSRNVSAMVGYMKPTDSRAFDDGRSTYIHPRTRVGIGLAIHF